MDRRILASLPIVVLCLVFAGCASPTTTIVPTVEMEQPLEVNDELAEDEAETEADAEQEQAQDVNSSVLGTRDNPLPIGTTVEISDGMGAIWEVTLGAPILDASEIVLGENMFNDEPPEGFQYALLPVTAKYMGDDTGTPSWDLNFAFVSAAGTTHKTYDVFVVVPDDLESSNELYPGGIAEGNIGIAIPTSDAELGTWRVSDSFEETNAFFEAQ